MKQSKYIVDGVEYEKLEDVPEHARKIIQSSDFRRNFDDTLNCHELVEVDTKYEIDGKTYESFEEVPEEYKELMEGNGTKFFVEDKEYNSIDELPEEFKKFAKQLDLNSGKTQFSLDIDKPLDLNSSADLFIKQALSKRDSADDAVNYLRTWNTILIVLVVVLGIYIFFN